MPREGQVIEGSGGFRLCIVRLTEAELEFDATYGGDGPMPPEHLHPSQEERFEVREGAMRTVIDGAERTYSAGESFTVGAGVRHTMRADGPTRLTWRITPALRTAEFFEALHDGTAAEDPAAFLEEYAAEFRLAGAAPSAS